MNFHSWLAFLLGVVVICGSPGPNMLQVMASSAKYGMRRTFFTMFGCFFAVYIMIGASVAGVGIFIESFPAMFNALRYIGAAYLVYLGVSAWRAKVVARDDNAIATGGSAKEIFMRGFMVGISNPKALLFATAFFPQFIDPHAPEGLQLTILLVTFGVVEFSWYLMYAFSGSRFQQVLRRASIQKRFNRCTGGLFIVFGVAMAAKS